MNIDGQGSGHSKDPLPHACDGAESGAASNVNGGKGAAAQAKKGHKRRNRRHHSWYIFT